MPRVSRLGYVAAAVAGIALLVGLVAMRHYAPCGGRSGCALMWGGDDRTIPERLHTYQTWSAVAATAFAALVLATATAVTAHLAHHIRRR